MRTMRLISARILAFFLALTWSAQPRPSWAHGGSGSGGLECGMMQQGGYAIHMDVYVYSQGGMAGMGGMGNFKSYCRNVPTTGKMSLVLDLVTPQLRKIPIECRVLSSDGKVVAYFPAQVYTSGVASLDLDLPNRGQYMVELTLVGKTGPDSKPLIFRFPITIGMGIVWVGLGAAGLLVASGAGFLVYRRMARRRSFAGSHGIQASAS